MARFKQNMIGDMKVKFLGLKVNLVLPFLLMVGEACVVRRAEKWPINTIRPRGGWDGDQNFGQRAVGMVGWSGVTSPQKHDDIVSSVACIITIIVCEQLDWKVSQQKRSWWISCLCVASFPWKYPSSYPWTSTHTTRKRQASRGRRTEGIPRSGYSQLSRES